jgi:hypothetical protein
MLHDQGVLAKKHGKLLLHGFATENFNIAKLIAPLYVRSALPYTASAMFTRILPLEALLLAVSSVTLVAVACCIALVLSSGFF